MQTVSLLDFRQDAEQLIARLQKSECMILTQDGKPVARLEPIIDEPVGDNDPFYSLPMLATAGESLTNEQIDATIYGE
jgi:antitoxin (DNA-binding transcriptional repressor) of toxin-antitoxin stability system